MAKQDGEFLVQKNDEDKVYSMKLSGNHHVFQDSDRSELREDLEGIVDILTKKLQRSIETSANEDGSHEIALDVSEEEIPKAVQALVSLVYKHSVMLDDRHSGNDASFHDVKPELPQLEDNIKIHEVNIAAKVSAAKIIEEQTVGVILAGKDVDGKQHELTMSFQLALANINSTNVDAMDITGLEIVEFQHPHQR